MTAHLLRLDLPDCVVRIPRDQAVAAPLLNALVELRGEEQGLAEWDRLVTYVAGQPSDRQSLAIVPAAVDGPAVRGVGWVRQISTEHPDFATIAAGVEEEPVASQVLSRRLMTWDTELSRGVVVVSLESGGPEGDTRLFETAQALVDRGNVTIEMHLETSDLGLFEDLAAFVVEWFTHP